MKELDDATISQQFMNEPLFGGVFNKSHLTKLREMGYVFNMDKATGGGTHWMAISNVNPNYVYYFDSFGQPPPVHLLSLMKQTGKKVIRNDRQLQDIDSESCGWWCIYFLREAFKDKNPTDILKPFTINTDANELRLENYYKYNGLLKTSA